MVGRESFSQRSCAEPRGPAPATPGLGAGSPRAAGPRGWLQLGRARTCCPSQLCSPHVCRWNCFPAQKRTVRLCFANSCQRLNQGSGVSNGRLEGTVVCDTEVRVHGLQAHFEHFCKILQSGCIGMACGRGSSRKGIILGSAFWRQGLGIIFLNCLEPPMHSSKNTAS